MEPSEPGCGRRRERGGEKKRKDRGRESTQKLNRERERVKEKKNNMNPSVVETHVRAVTLKAASTNTATSKLLRKAKSSEINTNFIPCKCYHVCLPFCRALEHRLFLF